MYSIIPIITCLENSIKASIGEYLFSLFKTLFQIQGEPKGSERFLKSGCGIQMSQATPTKFSMLFKHNYGKLFWKFGDHSFNFTFVHGPSWLRVLESIHRYGVIFTFWKKNSKGHCEAMLDVKKIWFIDFWRFFHEFFTGIEIFNFKSPSDL